MYCIVLYCTVLVNIECVVLYAYNCTVLYGIECTITHCTLYAIVLVNLNNGGPLGFRSGFIGQDIQRNDDDVQTVVTSKAKSKSKNWGWPSSSGVSKPTSCGGAALLWSCSFWDLITPNHLLLTSLSSTSGGAFMALVTPIRSYSLTLVSTESTCSSCSIALGLHCTDVSIHLVGWRSQVSALKYSFL